MEDGHDAAMFAWFSTLMLVRRKWIPPHKTNNKKTIPYIYLDATMNMVETLIHHSSQIDATEKTPTT